MLAPVLFTTLTLIVLVVGHLMMVSMPLLEGMNPVTESGLPLKSSCMLSVEASPEQVAVTVEAAAPDAIALVPKVIVPLQMVLVLPPLVAYWGMFKTPPARVAGPLVPVVVRLWNGTWVVDGLPTNALHG